MRALFTSRGPEDAALRIVVRHLVDAVANVYRDPAAFRTDLLMDCAADVEGATFTASDDRNVEDDRTEVLMILKNFLAPD